MKKWAAALVVLLIAVAAVLFFVVDRERASSSNAAEVARGRVHEGMALSEAVQALQGAWLHAQCSSRERFSVHLFVFGSKDLEKAGIVHLTAEGEPGQQRVTFVGRLENYRLPLYGECLSSGKST